MHHAPRCAAAAIAAAAALASTGLLAQTADPAVVPPGFESVTADPAFAVRPASVPAQSESLAAPVPEAQTAVPEQIPVEPSPATVAPIATPTAAVTASEAAAPSAKPGASNAKPTARAPVQQAVPAAEQDISDEAAAEEPEIAFVPPVDPLPVAEPAADAPTTPSRALDLLDYADYAVFGFIFLALVASFALRRTPKPKKYVARPLERTPVNAAPPARETIVPTATPELALASSAPPRRSNPVEPAGAGAAVALPHRVPTDFEERSALLQRMVAAPPDRANPFRSRRARLHRARLILQSIGRKFERADPWIDLSDYPNIWPELAGRKIPQAA